MHILFPYPHSKWFFFFQFLTTLDAREIYAQVLQHMPDLHILTKQSFEVTDLNMNYNNTGLILPWSELIDVHPTMPVPLLQFSKYMHSFLPALNLVSSLTVVLICKRYNSYALAS